MHLNKTLNTKGWRRHYAALVGVLILAVSLGSMVQQTLAVDPPNIISYQGRILDTVGVPISAATAEMTFALYDGPDTGTDTCLWSNDSASCNAGAGPIADITVTLTDGLFSENLGDTSALYAAITDSVFADNITLYLAVNINGEDLDPLKRVTAQGFAINSSLLDGLNSSAAGGTTAFVPVTGANGNLVLTGDPQGALVNQGSLYVNPVAAAVGETLFGLAVGGIQTFKIDADGNSEQTGDITADGILTINGVGESLFIDEVTIQGNITLGNAASDTLTLNSTIIGASPFTLEGSTANDFETTLTVVDPTGDNVIFIPNASGTMALSSSITLQNAYDTGNTILTTDARDLEITLPDTATDPNAIFNLTGAGDFIIKDGGTAFVTFNDSGNAIFANSVDLGSSGADSIAVNGVFSTSLISDGDADTSLGTDAGRWPSLYLDESDALHIGVGLFDEGTIGYDSGSNELQIGATSNNITLAGTLLQLSTGQVSTSGDLAVNGDDITSDGTLTIDSSGTVQLGTDDDFLPQLGAGSADIGSVGARWDNLYAAAADITGTLSAGTLTCTDCLNFTSFLDAMSLDASTSVDVGANNLQFSGSSTGDFIFGADADTNVRITASAAPAVSMLALSNASFPSATNNAHGISLSFFATDVSANPIQVAPDYSGNGGDVFSVFSAGNMNAASSGTDTVNGLSIGTIAETGSITSAALNISTGWDKILDSTLDIAGSSGDISDDSGAVTINDDLTITTGTTLSATSITTFNCTDCTNFDDISDAPSLDAALAISQGSFAWTQDYSGTTGNGVGLTAGSLTTGSGLSIQRANAGGSDYDGSASTALVYIDQQDVGIGTGNALQVVQKTVGTGSGVYIVQNTVGTPAADSISNQALVIDINEATSADTVFRIRSNVTAAANTIFDISNFGGLIADAGIVAGNATANSWFSFTSSTTTTDSMNLVFDTVTTGDGMDLTVDALTTGSGIKINRADGGTDFDGGSADALVYIDQANNNATSDGEALKVNNMGGGSSVGVYIVQNSIDAPASGSIGNQAMVIDTTEAGSNDDLIIFRSNGGTDTEFIFESDGDAFADGAWTGGGADLAESYQSHEVLLPGDVVSFDPSTSMYVKKSQSGYEPLLAGVISTKPAFRMSGQPAGDNLGYDVALVGRTPVHVTNENGDIEAGDPLTSSATRPGYAMKATDFGAIVGFALEGLSGSEGDILAFVRASYRGQDGTAPSAASNTASQAGSSSFASLDMTGNLFMGGQQILSIGRLAGMSDNWNVEEDGTFVTTKTYTANIATTQGGTATVTSVMSPEVTITLSGTSELDHGQASINFEQIDPTFNDTISTVAPIRVIVTANGPTGPLYVGEKDNNGFTVEESSGSSSGVSFDWLVIAYRNGYEPVEELEAPEVVLEIVVEEPSEGEPEVVEADPIIEQTPTETPTETINEPEEVVSEETPTEEPAPITEEPIATDEPTTT